MAIYLSQKYNKYRKIGFIDGGMVRSLEY